MTGTHTDWYPTQWQWRWRVFAVLVFWYSFGICYLLFMKVIFCSYRCCTCDSSALTRLFLAQIWLICCLSKFSYISTNNIYFISCDYIEVKLDDISDRLGEHLRSVRNNDVDISVARFFNIPNHSVSHMEICAFAHIILELLMQAIRDKKGAPFSNLESLTSRA